MDCSPPGSAIHGISRQEDWSGVPLPSPISLPTSHQKPSDDLFLLIPTIFLKYLYPLTCSNQISSHNCIETVFVNVTKDTHLTKSNNQFSLFLFLDFYTAFDMGPPSLKELFSFDFRNTLLPWIYS